MIRPFAWSRASGWLACLGLALGPACSGGKDDDDGVVPKDTADADTDTDTDADTDADTDTDTEPVGRCAPLPDEGGTPVGGDLAQAVADAAPGDVLLLADGTYALTRTLVIDKALTLRSASGDRGAVVLDGSGHLGDLVEIRAGDVTLTALTLRSAGADAVQLRAGAAGFTGVRLHDLQVEDPVRFVVAAEGDLAAGTGPDQVEVSCVAATLSAAGRARITGACETGGVDAAGVRDWLVRDSTFAGFWCPRDATLAGIRFWRGSRDVEVTRNVLTDVATGIVLGEGQDQIGRVYPDEPCGTADVLQAVGATATNNVVSAFDDDLVNGTDGVKVGILAESSCDVTVVHNSLFAGAPPALASIQQRFPTTSGVIANNLVSHDLIRLDDGDADVAGNVENAPFDSWFFPAQGDFHTSPGATWAIDQGDPAHTVPDDVDGEPRDDGLPDVGADER